MSLPAAPKVPTMLALSALPLLLLLLPYPGAPTRPFASAFGVVAIIRSRTPSSRATAPPPRATTTIGLVPIDRLARRRSHRHRQSTTISRTAVNGVDRATDRYDELMEWFVNSDPNSYVSPKVDIRPSTRGGLSTGGYGTFVSDDLEEGELVLRLPRSCCVTLDDALNDVECGSAFRKLLETAGPGAGEWWMDGPTTPTCVRVCPLLSFLAKLPGFKGRRLHRFRLSNYIRHRYNSRISREGVSPPRGVRQEAQGGGNAGR